MSTLTIPGISKAMTPIPDGTYEAEISSAKSIKMGDNDAIVVNWTIMSDGDCLGKEIAQFFNLSQPIQVRMLGQLLKALDVDVVDDKIDTDELVGRTANIVVSTTEKDDQEYTNVRRVIPS